jgi:RNA polymerase sigma factor FliA
MSNVTTLTHREQLILEHLPQVHLLARRAYDRCHRQVEFDDLFQAGVPGLTHAGDRFQPERQCLLRTLADHRIRGAILDYLRQLDPLPRSIRRFVRLGEEAELRLERHLGQRPCETELADALNLPIRTYRQLDRAVRAAQPHSLEAVPESAIARHT